MLSSVTVERTVNLFLQVKLIVAQSVLLSLSPGTGWGIPAVVSINDSPVLRSIKVLSLSPPTSGRGGGAVMRDDTG